MDVGSLNSYSSSVNGLRNLGLRVLIWNMGHEQYLFLETLGLTDLVCGKFLSRGLGNHQLPPLLKESAL